MTLFCAVCREGLPRDELTVDAEGVYRCSRCVRKTERVKQQGQGA